MNNNKKTNETFQQIYWNYAFIDDIVEYVQLYNKYNHACIKYNLDNRMFGRSKKANKKRYQLSFIYDSTVKRELIINEYKSNIYTFLLYFSIKKKKGVYIFQHLNFKKNE